MQDHKLLWRDKLKNRISLKIIFQSLTKVMTTWGLSLFIPRSKPKSELRACATLLLSIRDDIPPPWNPLVILKLCWKTFMLKLSLVHSRVGQSLLVNANFQITWGFIVEKQDLFSLEYSGDIGSVSRNQKWEHATPCFYAMISHRDDTPWYFWSCIEKHFEFVLALALSFVHEHDNPLSWMYKKERWDRRSATFQVTKDFSQGFSMLLMIFFWFWLTDWEPCLADTMQYFNRIFQIKMSSRRRLFDWSKENRRRMRSHNFFSQLQKWTKTEYKIDSDQAVFVIKFEYFFISISSFHSDLWTFPPCLWSCCSQQEQEETHSSPSINIWK